MLKEQSSANSSRHQCLIPDGKTGSNGNNGYFCLDLMAQYLRQSGLKLSQQRKHHHSSESTDRRSNKSYRGQNRNENDVVEVVRRSMAELSVSSGQSGAEKRSFGHNFPSVNSTIETPKKAGGKIVQSVGIQTSDAQNGTSVKTKEDSVPKAVSFFVPVEWKQSDVVRRSATYNRRKNDRDQIDRDRERQPTLQEALRMKRPTFVSKARERVEILTLRSYLRDKSVFKQRTRFLSERMDSNAANGSDSGLGESLYIVYFTILKRYREFTQQ
jgi:hypothetical protein